MEVPPKHALEVASTQPLHEGAVQRLVVALQDCTPVHVSQASPPVPQALLLDAGLMHWPARQQPLGQLVSSQVLPEPPPEPALPPAPPTPPEPPEPPLLPPWQKPTTQV